MPEATVSRRWGDVEDNGRERLLSLMFPDRAAGYLVIAVSAGISVAAQTEAAGADLLIADTGRPMMDNGSPRARR